MRSLLLVGLLGAAGACVEEPGTPRAPSAFFVHANVVYANAMGSSFRLRRVTISFDGQPFATRELPSAATPELPLGVATLQGGEHDVIVEAEYQGNGFGVFAYLAKYRFKARLAYRLELPDARPRTIRCTGYEHGGPTTPLEERPQIRCEAIVTS